MQEIIKDPSNICLSCGLCCDGSLIGYVQLEKEEIPAIRELMEIEEVEEHGFFLHPCSKFCNGCTIYADRPRQCDKFKCELLQKVEKQDLEFDSALVIIEKVKEKKIAIQKNIAFLEIALKSPSFYFQMVELKNVFKNSDSDSIKSDNHLELIADITQLDVLLSKEFGVMLN